MIFKGNWLVTRPFEIYQPGDVVTVIQFFSNPREIAEFRLTLMDANGALHTFEIQGTDPIESGWLRWQPPDFPPELGEDLQSALRTFWGDPDHVDDWAITPLREMSSLPIGVLPYLVGRNISAPVLAELVAKTGAEGARWLESEYFDEKSAVFESTHILETLAFSKSRVILPELERRASAESSMRRNEAGKLLGILGLPECTPILTKLSQDPAWNVADTARKALANIQK